MTRSNTATSRPPNSPPKRAARKAPAPKATKSPPSPPAAVLALRGAIEVARSALSIAAMGLRGSEPVDKEAMRATLLNAHQNLGMCMDALAPFLSLHPERAMPPKCSTAEWEAWAWRTILIRVEELAWAAHGRDLPPKFRLAAAHFQNTHAVLLRGSEPSSTLRLGKGDRSLTCLLSEAQTPRRKP